jgi:hypothetical protein
MDKLAAYETILAKHPLWTKEAIFLDPLHYAAVMLPAAAAAGALSGAATAYAAPSDASADRKDTLKGALRGASTAPLAMGLSALATMAAHKKGLDLNPLLSPLLGAAVTGHVAARYAAKNRRKKD